MAFTRAWQEAYPDDENFGYELDDYQRQIRVDVRERVGLQHKTYADESGHTDVAEHKAGECNIAFVGAKASFPVPATSNAGCLAVATDENNQLYYWSGSAWTKVQEPVLITGDQTIAGAKTFSNAVVINGAATLNAISTIKDGSAMSTSAAPTEDAMIANKKYVDDQDAADHPAYSGGESHTDGSGLITKAGHKTTPSGDVTSGNVPVSFGTAFPTACVAVVVTLRNDTLINVCYSVDSVSKTGFTFYYAEAGAGSQACDGFDWIAIGY